MVQLVSPYWLLIAVLQSTIPLAEPLAMRLYQAAMDLHREERDRETLTGDLAMGTVTRLKKDLLLGSIGGPGFEAEIDTPSGSGRVRFILTREGLERDPAPPSMAN
jgi:hypothetical protein